MNFSNSVYRLTRSDKNDVRCHYKVGDIHDFYPLNVTINVNGREEKDVFLIPCVIRDGVTYLINPPKSLRNLRNKPNLDFLMPLCHEQVKYLRTGLEKSRYVMVRNFSVVYETKFGKPKIGTINPIYLIENLEGKSSYEPRDDCLEKAIINEVNLRNISSPKIRFAFVFLITEEIIQDYPGILNKKLFRSLFLSTFSSKFGGNLDDFIRHHNISADFYIPFDKDILRSTCNLKSNNLILDIMRDSTYHYTICNLVNSKCPANIEDHFWLIYCVLRRILTKEELNNVITKYIRDVTISKCPNNHGKFIRYGNKHNMFMRIKYKTPREFHDAALKYYADKEDPFADNII